MSRDSHTRLRNRPLLIQRDQYHVWHCDSLRHPRDAHGHHWIDRGETLPAVLAWRAWLSTSPFLSQDWSMVMSPDAGKPGTSFLRCVESLPSKLLIASFHFTSKLVKVLALTKILVYVRMYRCVYIPGRDCAALCWWGPKAWNSCPGFAPSFFGTQSALDFFMYMYMYVCMYNLCHVW